MRQELTTTYRKAQRIEKSRLGPLNFREVLESRLSYLAQSHGKDDYIVSRTLLAIEQVANTADRFSTPREMIVAVHGVLQAWDETSTSTDSAAIETSLAFVRYLRDRADLVGILLALLLYFLASQSDEDFQEESLQQHRQLVELIESVLQTQETVPLVYITNARVNLRKGSSTSERVLHTLAEGLRVSVRGSDGIWLHVDVVLDETTATGWVHGRFVTPILSNTSNNRVETDAP